MLQAKVKNLRAGYLVYLGERVLPFGKDLYAIPAGWCHAESINSIKI